MEPSLPLSEAAGTPVDVSNLSHLRAWQDAVSSHPRHTALISCHQQFNQLGWLGRTISTEDEAHLSYTDLDRCARRLATTLNRLTPIQRRPIAVFLDNQAEWLLIFLAAAYLHSPLLPINPKSVARKEELQYMLHTVQPAVLVTADCVIAQCLDRSDVLKGAQIRIVINSEHLHLAPSWQCLADIINGELTPPDTPLVADAQETAVILFTSGTTSLPKPCAISSAQTANAAIAYHLPRLVTSDTKYIAHLPNFHSYGIGWTLSILLAGGTLIIPSRAFEAQASIECVAKFGATHMSLVPTTAQALIAHPTFAAMNITSLTNIDISGAGVLPHVIESCEKAFGIQIGMSYGMTESPTTLVWSSEDGSALRNGQVFSGKPSRGARVKICEPGTRTVLPRGVPGELHNGGLQVIHEYLTTDPASSFYTDDLGCAWMISGDQAVMDEHGAVRICGRYKDLIIRGGENISSANIEACLQQASGVHMAQVIGVPDELAGEVPVAVVQATPGMQICSTALRAMALTSLGPASAPKLVLDLTADLNLHCFPMTAAGKIRKGELAAIVKEYLAHHDQDEVPSMSTVEHLIDIWCRISGSDVLASETTIQSFADSIMMMQVSSLVKKELGKDVMVEDFKSCRTIGDQANLIELRSAISMPVIPRNRATPPDASDVTHLQGNRQAFSVMKTQICTAINKHNLQWLDVEDISVLPDWDAIFAERSRAQSWSLRWSYHCKVDSTKLEKALQTILPANQALRSVVVQTDHELPLLATMRPNQAWYAAAWTTGHILKHKEDLNTLLLDDPILDSTVSGGPMFRFHIASIEDGTSGLVVIASHAACDMTMTKLWLDDLAAVLSNEVSIIPHGTFHDYNTAFHHHRLGPAADEGVAYWAQKLHGIGSIPEGTLWPEQRAPEFFKGNDSGWCRSDGTKSRPYERQVPIDLKRRAQEGIRCVVPIASLSSLKSQHDVPIFMLMKAAIALLNVKITKASQALFGTLNAARKWPFRDDYSATERARYAGNPLDISGCTTEYVLDRIFVDGSENIVRFMQRVSKEEEQNSAYAKTPVFRLMDALRRPTSTDDTRSWLARERDAEAFLSLIRRQSFNWLPSAPVAQGSDQGLQMIQMLTRMDNGLTITGFLAHDKQSVVLAFTWDAEHLTLTEAEVALSQLADLVRLMGDDANWGHDVSQVIASC